MKSSERCKSSYQGDRCRFHMAHLSQDNSADPMQNFHVGAFTVWDDAGVVQAKAAGAEMSQHRNRRANKVYRILTGSELSTNVTNQAAIKEDLGKLEAFFGGRN